ncbi:hypothetical protein I5M86_00145 [Serratia marcescens]|nr:hypothetical protein [Serratia marcescens]MBH3063793.1 hypothetical protein [Serratia marcescens]
MTRGFRLRPLALLSLSFCCGTALAAPVQSEPGNREFLSVVQGIQVPTLPSERSGHKVLASHGDAAELKALRGEKVRLQQQNIQLQSRLQALAHQREASGSRKAPDKALRALQQEKAELTRQLAQTNAALQVSEQRAASLQPSAEHVQVVALQKENAELTTQLNTLREQRSTARSQASVPPQRHDIQEKTANIEALTQAKNQLKAQLIQVTADRNSQREAREAVAKELAELQARLQTQVAAGQGERRVLQQTINALQMRLDMLMKQSDADSVRQTTAQESVRVLTEKLTALQTQLAKQVARNGELEKQKNVLQAAEQQYTTQEKQNGTLQARLTATAKDNTDLKTQLIAAQADKAKADKAREEAVTEWQARLDGMMKENSDLHGRVAALTSSQEMAKKAADEARAALLAGQKMAQADKAQTERVNALQAQLVEVTKSNTDLKAQLAAQIKTPEAESKSPALPLQPAAVAVSLDLKSPQAQQAYASGVMMADLLRRTLALQTDLGEKPDTLTLLAGVKDGVMGKLQLDKSVLATQSEAVITRLSAKEKAKYDGGLKRMEALTAKKVLLKRNGTMFFVQVRKGGRKLKEGEPLSITLRESTLDGRVLRDDKAKRSVYGERLPYPVQQALMLGGLGGSVDIYCFASDIYVPNALPEGLFAYTLMKYTVSSQP